MKAIWDIRYLAASRVGDVRSANDPCRLGIAVILRFLSPTSADVVGYQRFQWPQFPAVGDVSDGAGDGLELFVTGKTKLDEPLTIERAGHLLQNPNPTPVVFHQPVVG